MPDDIARLADAVRRHYDDGCYACGRKNPMGVAATALDEVMVWAGILVEGVLSVTGNIGFRYRRPVSVAMQSWFRSCR